MKTLTRLIALSAVLSAPALALEALEDEDLAGSMGQAGVTVSITPPAAGYSFSTVLHDSNGYTGFTTPGALAIGNPLGVAGYTATTIDTPGTSTIDVLIDATGDIDSGTAGNQPALGIKVTLPANTVINTGTVSVARSNGGGVAVTNQSPVILNNMTFTLSGNTVLDMTLGNEMASTGQMMQVTTNMTSGLSISGFAIRDASATGPNSFAIRANSIAITNTGAANLNVNAKIDVIPTGLQATLTQLGSASGMDVSINNIQFGDTASASAGNLHLQGLNMNGSTLRLYGH